MAHFTRFLSDAQRSTLSTASSVVSQEKRTNCTHMCSSFNLSMVFNMCSTSEFRVNFNEQGIGA